MTVPPGPYLVTGGAGFIGSHLVSHLAERGAAVRVLDDFSTGKAVNLAPVRDRIELVEGDIRDPAAVARAVAGVRFVLHQAARPSVPRSIEDPVGCFEVNLMGTLRLLEAARQAGVERVVYAASSSAYGGSERLPKREDDRPQPLSPYAAAKLGGEHLAQVYTRVYGLACVALRYFNVFGPRQDPASPYAAVVPRFVTAVLAGRPALIYGDGDQSRDFCYVDNVVAANLVACTAPEAPGRVFNIACGERTSLLELLRALERLTGRPATARHEPARAGDVRHSLADISAARDLLGWQPAVMVEEGLRRVVAWYRQGA